MLPILLLSLAALSVLACGPFFPNWLLSDGDASLLAAPIASFRHELDRLRLPRVASRAVVAPRSHEEQTRDAELADLAMLARQRALPAETIELWKKTALQMRQEGVIPDPPVLPLEFHHYLVGAYSWSHEDIPKARKAWEQVLKLPAAERSFKSIWAAYMLGRSCESNAWKEAVGRYQEVRRLSEQGFQDPLGLAAASLGWEAQLLLRQKDFRGAIAGYLAQFASGDPSAMVSLRECARRSLEEGTDVQLVALAKEESCRRVIGAWLISTVPGSYREEDSSETPDRKLARWLNAVEAAGVKDTSSAEQLALASYRAGRWDMAQRWIKRAPTSPTVQWLNAKLWLRQGKVDKAAEILSRIVDAFPVVTVEPRLPYGDEFGRTDWTFLPLFTPVATHSEETNPPAPRTLEAGLAMDMGTEVPSVGSRDQVLGELGVLRLARREYTQALDALLRSDFWMDAAYVAERVLETDELKSYVDREWPAVEVEETAAPVAETSPVTEEQRREQRTRKEIRHLLARRLTRESRGDEASGYFPAEQRPRLDAFLAGMTRGSDTSLAVPERAAGWWEAAQIARHQGMELLGTEVEPDWAVHGGQFEAGVQISDRQRTNQWTRASADELARAERHAPTTRERFHYRYTAAALGWQAASLLPDHQDQTARILCTAGSWLKARDPKTADGFYKALVWRCRKTAIGHQADVMRWFPVLDESGNPLPWNPPMAVPEPPMEPNPSLDPDTDPDPGLEPKMELEPGVLPAPLDTADSPKP